MQRTNQPQLPYRSHNLIADTMQITVGVRASRTVAITRTTKCTGQGDRIGQVTTVRDARTPTGSMSYRLLWIEDKGS